MNNPNGITPDGDFRRWKKRKTGGETEGVLQFVGRVERETKDDAPPSSFRLVCVILHKHSFSILLFLFLLLFGSAGDLSTKEEGEEKRFLG